MRRQDQAIFTLAYALVAVLLVLLVVQKVSAGDDAKVTVNSTANVDDGDCEGAPNDDATGNCTLHEAIDMVNNGDADIITFHPPVFSKVQPGVIDLCADEGEGALPAVQRNIVIDSQNSGVILDGGLGDKQCSSPATVGLLAVAEANGLDFTLAGGKNFDIRNLECGAGVSGGIVVNGFVGGDFSLGDVSITGVDIDSVCGAGIHLQGELVANGAISNAEISSVEGDGIFLLCDDFQQSHIKVTGVAFSSITGQDIQHAGCESPTPTPTPTPLLPDLTITKTASSESVEVGQSLSYFIEVRNEGTDVAPVTRVIDDLPAAFIATGFSTSRGTCAIAESLEGGALDCDLGPLETGPGGFATMVVAGSFDLSGEFKNIAEVDPFDLVEESSEANNSSSIMVTVSSAPVMPTPTTAPVTATHSPTQTSTATPTTAATSPPSQTSTPALPAGDANCNGITDPIDATLVLQVVAGLLPFVPCRDAADVNLNGVADPVDAALILQSVAGLIQLA